VLEPLQTRDSIAGQLEELRMVVDEHGDPPLCIIGWSWGAWLGYLFAARYPSLVSKLILVGSGPFAEEYVPDIERTRSSRLSAANRAELETLQGALADPTVLDKDELLARFGALFARVDAYDPLPSNEAESMGVQFDIFNRVWSEAAELRASGELLRVGKQIQCEVVALHGDYDPHPAIGVREPLTRVIERFRFVLIDRCGHQPWAERAAREEFFRVLEAEALT
jgi:pimeloyl-ACP methyl ester carboxylesterase